MRYDRRGFLCLAALAAAMLAGCGGGGDSTPRGVYPLSTTLRTYQSGDIWNYTLHITRGAYTSNGFAGTSVRAEPLLAGPQPAVAFYSTSDYQNGGYSDTSFCRQDAATGDLLRIFSRKGFGVDPPVLTLPGKWSRDVAFTRALTDTQNNAERISLAVTGTERVTVPAGTFETWKTTVSESNFRYESSGTYWYAPQTGQYVKAIYDITFKAPYGDTTTATYEMQLTYTNVPLGG